MPAGNHRLELRAAVRAQVPDSPGVYTWLGRDGERLYVGKSRSIRRRMLSYLAPGQLSLDSRTRHLAFAIEAFEWRETRGELMALLLEDTVIKRLNPRHNERQKDYRERSYVLLTGDRFPACIVQRAESDRPGTLFGPFKDEYFSRDIVDLVTGVFGLRVCRDPEPFRHSARYDLGTCPGPCRGAISEADYAAMADRVRAFLDGDSKWITEQLTTSMLAAGNALRFEEAARLRDQLDFCRRFCARQRFFKAFESGAVVVEEPALKLCYRFEAGLLCEVRDDASACLEVPVELAASVSDRRLLLDRANLVYAWIARRKVEAGSPAAG